MDAPDQLDPTTHYYYDKSVNKLNDLSLLYRLLFEQSPGFDIYTPGDYYNVAGDRLWFAPPKESPIELLPNPDNKYIVMQPGPYQSGRIIVIHGKAPSFPARWLAESIRAEMALICGIGRFATMTLLCLFRLFGAWTIRRQLFKVATIQL